MECEVFNLFSGLIPQEGLNRLERGRKRQGILPDFRLRGSVAGMRVGVRGAVASESRLAELKVLSSCPTRYARAPRAREKAVKKRADQLPNEYLKKAQKVDTEYGGVPEGTMGPVATKLVSYPRLEGWVFGAWAECSPDVHELVREIAGARLRHEQELERKEGRGRRRGMSDVGALSVLTGQIRRGLSLVAARSQARLLLDRVEAVGNGAVQAAGRRKWVALEGWRMQKEQKAHMLGLQQGRTVLRRGEFFLQ